MIIKENQLKKLREEYKDKTIVFAIGTFDMLHYEHVRYLNRAKALGDILVVAVKDDESARLKGNNRPIVSQDQRLYLIDNLACVDYCFLTTHHDVTKITDTLNIQLDYDTLNWWQILYKSFEKLKPDILYCEQNKALAPSRNAISKIFGTKVVTCKRTAIVSTTKLIDKIKNIDNN